MCGVLRDMCVGECVWCGVLRDMCVWSVEGHVCGVEC